MAGWLSISCPWCQHRYQCQITIVTVEETAAAGMCTAGRLLQNRDSRNAPWIYVGRQSNRPEFYQWRRWAVRLLGKRQWHQQGQVCDYLKNRYVRGNDKESIKTQERMRSIVEKGACAIRVEG